MAQQKKKGPRLRGWASAHRNETCPELSQRDIWWGFRRKLKTLGLCKGSTQPAWALPIISRRLKKRLASNICLWQGTINQREGYGRGVTHMGTKELRANGIAHEWDRVWAGAYTNEHLPWQQESKQTEAEGLRKQSLTTRKKNINPETEALPLCGT